ncbi:hypothetical protein G4Y73_10720 [Wenzhouxiangella sp. XN201]|uniref:hypothetical protein n=1 Tax=Wenzhouxiangella sp. XN201 TaxID=2710755 RepID=UPI0013CAD550|nr:hypothetical protein [Wenzhouxiangella sp. XN201]NEZ04623.1 hypothetical protein [Wenzhouxiangella sp. XN201]
MRSGHEKKRDSELRLAAEAIGSFILGRIFLAKAIFPLLVGAMFLTGTWALLQDDLELREQQQRLTETADATIHDAWWRIDFDVETMGDAVNWQAATRPDLCIHVMMDMGLRGDQDAVFCRQWGGISYGSDLIKNSTLGDGKAVPWRNLNGEPEIDLRFSPRAFEWLESNQAWDRYGFGIDEEPTALEALVSQLDQPTEHLIHAWTHSRQLEMRFNPAQPAEALPSRLLAENPPLVESRLEWLIFPAMMGATAWAIGCFLMFFTSPKWLRTTVFLGSLALLPWWGDWIWRALDHLWSGSSQARVLVQSELMGMPPRLRVVDPGYRGEPEDIRQSWNLSTSMYSTAFDAVEFAYPGFVVPADEALATLVAQVNRSLYEQADDRITTVFEFLQDMESRRRTEAGLLFMEAARHISLDQSRSEKARRAALRLLRERAGYAGFISAHRPAPEVRLGYYLRLRNYPDVAVQTGVSAFLERTREEWHEQGKAYPDEV